LSGVISGVLENFPHAELIGVRHGLKGLLEGDTTPLLPRFQDEKERERLSHTPACALGSCRLCLPLYERDDTKYKKTREILEENGIDTLFYIGGNDSMDTVAKLGEYFDVMGAKCHIIGVSENH